MFRNRTSVIRWWLAIVSWIMLADDARAQQLAAAIPTADSEFATTALKPFWRTSELREPIFFIEGKDGGPPTGRLLFTPTEVISVMDGTRETTFEAGRDYNVDLTAGTITLPPGSRIPYKTQEQLYPLMTSNEPKIARRRGDRTRGIFFAEGSVYHRLQAEVRYRHKAGQWRGPVPSYAGASLAKTVQKLRGKQPLKVVISGDSISEGLNASLVTKVPPHFPPFGQLVALGLEKQFGSKVTFTNVAVDGTTSKDGLQLAKEKRISGESPDLIIIAFGMNDVYYRHDVATFKANISGMIDETRKIAPHAEFVLVAPMLANAERGVAMKLFQEYRDALVELCGPGVVLADVTSMWEELLKRKTYYDLTGNGVNHPNDFGHLVYAQTILALMIEAAK
jgi:lysophospholipase L1-like esterase